MKKLPIGIADYEKIIQGDYLYIDKTAYIHELASSAVPIFLSRPRRFGKTLTLSTLYYLFKGRRELFKGTFIYDKWDWQEHPVIHINLLETLADTVESLKESLLFAIGRQAEQYRVKLESGNYKLAFMELIERLSPKNKVVVLIDEYEKPLLDSINEPPRAAELRSVLRDFYTTVKAMDSSLRFVLLTGITTFTKAGVFSALNNLRDISLGEQYARMLGYTQEEWSAISSPSWEIPPRTSGFQGKNSWRKSRSTTMVFPSTVFTPCTIHFRY